VLIVTQAQTGAEDTPVARIHNLEDEEMGHFTRRSLTAMLAVIALATVAPAVTSAASSSPVVSVAGRQPVRAETAPVGDLTPDNPGSDFNWGDAGIGAAATLALIAVSAAALSATRRTGSSRQPSLHRG
jgi:hypothetical protein